MANNDKTQCKFHLVKKIRWYAENEEKSRRSLKRKKSTLWYSNFNFYWIIKPVKNKCIQITDDDFCYKGPYAFTYIKSNNRDSHLRGISFKWHMTQGEVVCCLHHTYIKQIKTMLKMSLLEKCAKYNFYIKSTIRLMKNCNCCHK